MKRTIVAAIAAVLGLANAAHALDLYSIDYAGLTPLYNMNQTTGAATPIGPTGFDNLGDLTSDTRAGSARLWGIRIPSNELVKINPATGAASVAATLNSPDDIISIAFDVVSGKLYGNTSVGYGAPFEALYEINPNTGNTTFIGRILFDNVYALGFDQSGVLYGVSDVTNQLIKINTTNGNGSLVAMLQVDQAFDIASRPLDNKMFLVDTSSHRLWDLNTANGALTNVGPYGGSPNLVGLAFAPIPEPSTLALAAAGLAMGALRWRRRK